LHIFIYFVTYSVYIDSRVFVKRVEFVCVVVTYVYAASLFTPLTFVNWTPAFVTHYTAADCSLSFIHSVFLAFLQHYSYYSKYSACEVLATFQMHLRTLQHKFLFSR